MSVLFLLVYVVEYVIDGVLDVGHLNIFCFLVLLNL